MNERLKKLCFIDMPFGEKRDAKTGVSIDFNQVYEQGIKPGVIQAGLSCIRGDHENTGGIIHTAMFARLLMSEFVVADLTTANPNVFYELGIRHAAKPMTTIPIYATLGEIPFDVGFIRAIPYELVNGKLTEQGAAALIDALSKRIRIALEGPLTKDSPLFDLFDDFPGIQMSHQLTDIFRDRVKYSDEVKAQLAAIRNDEADAAIRLVALQTKQTEFGDLKVVERGILVDLLLSYRSLNGWQQIIDLYDLLPSDCQTSTIVQQQYAMALNRVGGKVNANKAISVLQQVIQQKGGSAESYGLLGRIYKDMYKQAQEKGKELKATANLDLSIGAYTKGFECEPADYYPGINAITLLVQKGSNEAKLAAEKLAPLVAFAVSRQGGLQSTDYWTVATVFELAAIQKDQPMMAQALPRLLVLAKEMFEPKTTADNLQLILNLTTEPVQQQVLQEAIDALLACEQDLIDGD